MLTAPCVRSAAGPPWKNGKSFATVPEGVRGMQGSREGLGARRACSKQGQRAPCAQQPPAALLPWHSHRIGKMRQLV